MKTILAHSLYMSLSALSLLGCSSSPSTTQRDVSSIYWSDGDSGRIDGIPFRLANVDAPETGDVGANGGAKCESERVIGYDAKAYIAELTRFAILTVTASYGADRYGRDVIDLAADGQDVGRSGINAGVMAPWPHVNGVSQTHKPHWC